jgi:WD40 repeat protein/predicted Ser/Thr protein kinase
LLAVSGADDSTKLVSAVQRLLLGPAREGNEPAPLGVLGDFELLEKIGKGGMGVVYRARQRSLNRIVALKLIRPDHLDELSAEQRQEWSRHVQNESQTAARLEHENVVPIYEVGEINGQPYLAMRYLEGRSLAEVVREKPLSNRQAATYMEAVARAIHYAHEKKILHRDLKPKNILIDGNDRPLVADFGLAKWLETGRHSVHTKGPSGTPAYAPPEQTQEKARITAASDIYSLGATLYELLTGRVPFQSADVVETWRQVREEEPVPPRQLNPAIDRNLETITLKCLQKEPARRYASAEALANDLRHYLRGEPIDAQPVGALERCWLWVRRKPALAACVALGVFTLVAVATLAVGTIFAVQLGQAHARTKDALTKAEEYRQQSERLSVTLALQRGQTLCEHGDITSGMLWFARSLEMATWTKATDLERVIRINLASWQRQLSPLKACFPHDSEVLAVAFSPDGKTVLTGSRDGIARFWDVATGKLRDIRLVHTDPVCAVAFSPNGKLCLTGTGELKENRRGEACLWDVATGKPRHPCVPYRGTVHAVAFSPDGQMAFTGGVARIAHLWDVATGQIRAALKHDDVVTAAAFSPDGRTLVTGSWKIAWVWDAATGQFLGKRFPHQGYIQALAFSPTGKRVLTGSGDRTARLWETATGEPASEPLRHFGDVSAVAFSHDEKFFVTGCGDKLVRFWQTETNKPLGSPLHHLSRVTALALSADGKIALTGSADKVARLWSMAGLLHPVRSFPHAASVSTVCFSPDGKTILTGSFDHTAQLWETTTGKPIGQPLVHQDGVSAASFSPDGKTILTRSMDRTISLWEAATGKRLQPFNRPPNLVNSVAFSPNGKIILTGTSEGVAQMWDVSAGQPIGHPFRHQHPIRVAAFGRDGKTVLTAGIDSTARVWSAVTGKLLSELTGHEGPIQSAATSPDGTFVVTGSYDNTAQLWETPTGKPIGPRLLHQDRVQAVAISPSGKLVLTGSLDGTARLWESATGKPIGPYLHHPSIVWAIAFSPDEKSILTGGWDGTARLWDVATGEPLGPAFEHPHQVRAVGFSPNGKTLVTGGDGGFAQLWETPAPLEGEVRGIVVWTQFLTGLELGEGGEIRVLDYPSWSERQRRIKELSGGQGT